MIPLLAGAFVSRAEITCNTTYRVDPIGAAPTDTTFNAALAPTGKIYADSTGHSVRYAGELPVNITLARGGSLLLD